MQLGSAAGRLPAIPLLGLAEMVVVVKVHHYFGSGSLQVLEINFRNLNDP